MSELQALLPLRDLESGSDEERAVRGVWLSRLMFGFVSPPELAPHYAEGRTYEEWLNAQGYRLV